jgi:hypothetical protein
VGNNIPVFFIQDAIKFPDLVHAVKMEPDRGFPQAASAHDTFWDFVSLMPESMHMLMWAMSDRAIPRSLRMMEGFGVHTFRSSTRRANHFVKFHWKPRWACSPRVGRGGEDLAGPTPTSTAATCGRRSRRRLPEWELGVQVFDEEQAASSLRRARPTKLIPEELVPVRIVGRMVLNRNPTTSSPRPSRWRSARPTSCPASTSPTTRCCRGGCSPTSTRSSRGWAGQLPPDPDQRARCAGAQQPARRHAQTVRFWARPELALL